MSFAGKVWRLLVGIKDALALVLLLLFFVLLFAALSARPNPGVVREGALDLALNGSLVEESASIDPLSVLMSGTLPMRQYEAREVVRAIDEAAKDDRIKAIALDLSTFLGGGQVHVQEVAAALDRFRAADKPVIAYALAYTDDSMMLAAHASEVWVDPMGGVALAGPGGERLYYGDFLERYGVNMHVFRVGTYKSAVEPYMQDGMSPEARENAEQLYTALWEEWRANVKQARAGADIDRMTGDLLALVEENDGDLAKAAIAADMADTIGTYEQWGDRVAEVAGRDEWDDQPGAYAATEYDPWIAEIGQEGLGEGNRIGVVTVAGEITDTDNSTGTAGARRITGLLDDALDDDLDALVVRIDSPGGTVTGAESIRRAVMRHKAKGIPVVVSMANYAASGGYWIATAGDTLFAEPETLTGSIGVFATLPTFETLLGDFGIATDGVRTTPYSGQPDLFAGLTPETSMLLQTQVDSIYTRFIALVAEARGISVERADELGQGRVWAGGNARQLGLVDRFGDLDAALAHAAAEAGLAEGDWEPVFLGGSDDPFGPLIAQLLGQQSAQAPAHDLFTRLAMRQEDDAGRILADLQGLFARKGAQALCLECPPARGSGNAAGQHSGHGGMLENLLLRLAGE